MPEDSSKRRRGERRTAAVATETLTGVAGSAGCTAIGACRGRDFEAAAAGAAAPLGFPPRSKRCACERCERNAFAEKG